MPQQKSIISLTAILFFMGMLAVVSAGDAGLVSTNELMSAVSSFDGIRIVPAPDVPVSRYTEDLTPPQVLEIFRPNQGPIVVGRLTTSCSCLSATMTDRRFGQGERALIIVRNVKATPPGGATYAVFVQLTSPYATALQYDLFVKSDMESEGMIGSISRPSGVVQSPSGVEYPAASAAPGVRPGAVRTPPLQYENIQPYAPKIRDDSDMKSVSEPQEDNIE